MERLAAIVVDAVEGPLLDRLIAGGDLPVLGRLRARAAVARLRSPRAYVTESTCTSLLTGRAADTNRYWSTIGFDPDSYAVRTMGSAVREPFFAGLDHPLRTVTFDIPHSVLTDSVDGLQVVGWGGHDARFQHTRSSLPSSLLGEIDRRFGLDPASAVEYTGDWHQPAYVARLTDALVAGSRRRADIARWLLEQAPDWELFVTGMSELHSAGHVMAHGFDPTHPLGAHPSAATARESLLAVFRAVDDAIGRIEAALPYDAGLVVVSPKGMLADRDDVASTLLLAELLYRLDTGATRLHEPGHGRWGADGCPAIVLDPTLPVHLHLRRRRSSAAAGSWVRRVRATGPVGLDRARASARRSAARLVGPFRDGHGRGGADAPQAGPVWGDVDWQPAAWYRDSWPGMRAFALPSFSDGHIRLNLAGRERNGIVPADAYAAECQRVESTLRRVRDPRTGEPAVDEVIPMRTDDPTAPDGPAADLVVTWRSPVDAFEHPDAGRVGPFPFPRTGSHTDHGFAFIAGPGVVPGDVGEHSVTAVGPTVLELLGRTPPDRLDGRSFLHLTEPLH